MQIILRIPALFTQLPFRFEFYVRSKIKLKSDSTGYEISGTLSLKKLSNKKFVIHYWWKKIDVERNHNDHDIKIYGIEKDFCH